MFPLCGWFLLRCGNGAEGRQQDPLETLGQLIQDIPICAVSAILGPCALEKTLNVYLEDFLNLKGSTDARAMPTDGSSGVVLSGTVRWCTRDATSKLPYTKKVWIVASRLLGSLKWKFKLLRFDGLNRCWVDREFKKFSVVCVSRCCIRFFIKLFAKCS
jgi:hypothetical protein